MQPVTSIPAYCSFVTVLICPASSSGQRALIRAGWREVGRFRGGGTADRHPDQEEHICRHAVLDGSGGHQAVSIRLQGESADARTAFSLKLCLVGFVAIKSLIKMIVMPIKHPMSGWHLVTGNHCHWTGKGGTPQLGPAPDEGPFPHP